LFQSNYCRRQSAFVELQAASPRFDLVNQIERHVELQKIGYKELVLEEAEMLLLCPKKATKKQ
jgi:hypothetical protein